MEGTFDLKVAVFEAYRIFRRMQRGGLEQFLSSKIIWINVIFISLPTACIESNCDEKTRRYDSGVLAEKVIICDGSEEYTTYFRNGKIKHHVQNGFTQAFDSLGARLWSSETVNDTLHGIYREYYANGKLKIESMMSKGLQSGEYREYFDDGRLKVIANYDQGIQLDFKQYYWSGGLMMDASYSEGFPVKYVKFDSSGNVIESVNAVDTTLNVHTNIDETRPPTSSRINEL
jgi:hypothetical protein